MASLTIPALMKSYQKSQWIAGYKQGYSIVNQATRMIMADNGGTLLGTGWDAANGFSLDMYNSYVPYLKIIKKCEAESPKGNCFASSYKTMNGFDYNILLTINYSVILSNGMSIAFRVLGGSDQNGDINAIYIDTNGKKGPNVVGKDFHRIYVEVGHKNVIYPYGYGLSDSDYNTVCPSTLTGGGGTYCGNRILKGDYGEDY